MHHRKAVLVLTSLLSAFAVGPAAASAAQLSFTTPGEHAFTVPAGVASIQVLLVGGRGGAGTGSNTIAAPGGLGSTVTATLAVSPGETLTAQVAGDGSQIGPGGYGGGGRGGPVEAFLAGAPGGGGGGGSSAVRRCPGTGCAPLVVAGGGGGGGGAGRDTTPTISGGDGGAGGLPGSAGEDDLTKHDAGGTGGGAGTQSAGGGAGTHSYEKAATAGSLAAGGAGGTSIGGGGGGGGGGLYGGGGGGAGDGYANFDTLQFFSAAGGGGGGGSSGVPAGAAGVSGYSMLATAAGAGASVTFTWTPPPEAGAGTPAAVTPVAGAAPVVSGLRLSRSRFRRGTRVTFTLSEAAAVTLTFERATPGRRAGRRCVPATRARSRRRRCTRYVRVRGTVRRNAPAGTSRIRFAGVLDGGRRLTAGGYRLTLVAVDAAGRTSAPRRAAFTIS